MMRTPHQPNCELNLYMLSLVGNRVGSVLGGTLIQAKLLVSFLLFFKNANICLDTGMTSALTQPYHTA